LRGGGNQKPVRVWKKRINRKKESGITVALLGKAAKLRLVDAVGNSNHQRGGQGANKRPKIHPEIHNRLHGKKTFSTDPKKRNLKKWRRNQRKSGELPPLGTNLR